MKASDYIVKFLVDHGTDTAFVFTGGAIAHIIDSMRNYKEKISYYCVQNEQVGAMAAEAYTRTTGRMGVQMVTSGPGASNMITGIAGAWYDCIPAVYLSGQVRTWELTNTDQVISNDRTDEEMKKGLLQRGFQEIDIVNIVKPITKYAVTITKPDDIRYEFEKAYYFAREGRPGPVLIDIPMDMQWAEINPDELRGFQPPNNQPTDSQSLIKCKEMISNSLKPLIIAGGGIRQGDAVSEFKELIERTGIPVIFSYAGYDALPYDHPNNGGVMGQFGQYGANFVTYNTDLVIALGTRFTIRQIGNKPKEFAPNAKIINVNIDEGELIGGRVKADLTVRCDIKNFIKHLSELNYKTNPKWQNFVMESKVKYPIVLDEYKKEKLVNPYVFMDMLSKKIDDDAIIIPEIGTNVIVSCQVLQLKENQRLFSSWANSPMGYSIPASIGAQLGNPGRQIIGILGDGGLQVNLQDLQTIRNYNLPIKIFIWNNHGYATIQDFQDGNLDGRYEATDIEHGYSHPDFSKIAAAYDIPHILISSNDELTKIELALKAKGPVLCELSMDSKFRVSPRQGANDQFHELSPKRTFSLF